MKHNLSRKTRQQRSGKELHAPRAQILPLPVHPVSRPHPYPLRNGTKRNIQIWRFRARMPTRKKYQCRRITMLFQKAYFIQLIWHPNNWPFWFRLVVRCPLCENSVKYLKLNEHIDNGCKVPSSSDAVKTWSKIMTGSKKEKHKYVNMSPYLFYLYFHVGGKKTVIVTENIRFQSKLMPPSKIGKSRKCFSNMIYQWTEIGQSGNNDTSGIASHHALDFRFLFFLFQLGHAVQL